MSNRNFDNSVIIKRIRDKNYARNLYINNTNGKNIINNPQNSNGDSSQLTNFTPGAQTEYFKGFLGGQETVNIGGIVNIPPFPPPDIILTPPSVPTINSITPGNQQLSINFTVPTSNGGSVITSYDYSTDNGSNWTNTITIISPIVITGLTNGTTYNVIIRARNIIGPGNGSNMVQGTPVTNPSPPTDLSGTPGNQQVNVSFIPGNDGGSPITNYQYSTDNGTTFTEFSPADTTSPVTITTLSSDGTTFLTNGTSYIIKLKAVTAVNISIESSSITVTPVTVPDAPFITGIQPINQGLIVNFTQGSNGGSPIINYLYSTDNETTFRTFSPVDITSPLIILTLSSDGTTFLTNGTSYSIIIQAINSVDNSPSSNAVSATPTPNTTNTYINSTTWTVPANVYRVTYTLVGGGGGSGAGGTSSGAGGGGGGGMVLSNTSSVIPGQNYGISIGSGGNGGTAAGGLPTNGGNTLIIGIATALGGSRGFNSSEGGGGLGGIRATNPNIASTGGRGNTTNLGGGGGGGSSGNGSNNSSNTGGAGGTGTIVSSTTYGTGGNGGTGGVAANGIAGGANTGNGARGASSTNLNPRNGAAGGSGRAILIY
jgi:hypothetical protein